MVILVLLGTIIGLAHIPEKKIDPPLQPYYDTFEQLVHLSCPNKDLTRNPGRVNITLRDFPDESGIAGVCTTFLNIAHIEIDASLWDEFNHDQRYSVAMHELTHCFLGHWFLAKYPFHTPDVTHYMHYRMIDQTVFQVQQQVIDVAKEMCGT